MRILTAMISLLLVSMLVFPLMAFAAVSPIHLFLDGKQLAAEVPPRIIKDNTVVPIRIIAESLGAKVQWEGKSRKVTVNKDDVNIQLFIDKQNVTVNNKPYKLETAPAIIEGNTLLPLRFVSEQLGVKVTWDEATRSVFLFQTPDDASKAAADASDAVVEGKEPSAGGKNAAVGAKEETAAGKPGAEDVRESETPAYVAAKGNPADKPGAVPVTAQSTDTVSAKPDDKTATGQNASTGGKAAETLTTVSSVAVDGDRFTVKTSGAQAAPKVTYAVEPDAIVIDIPNAQLDPSLKLNANGEGTVKGNNPAISQIRYLLFSKESSIVRIIIDLTKKLELKPAGATSANQLSWSLITPKDRYRVVIDPGHGGKDTGALGVTKRREKDFVLALGLKVQKLLEKEPKIEVLMTRDDDTFVELSGRTAFANDRQADLFVAVHANSAGNESVQGTETYYYTEQSLPFAKLMHAQLLKGTGFPDRKVKQSGFYVIKNTTMPSLLLEVGFLSNREEENAMFQDAFQNQVAASIVAAIKQQLNIN